MSGPEERPYEIDWSSSVARHWKRLLGQASRKHRLKRFMASARSIVERLKSEPLIFGEILGHLPHLGLEVRVGAVAPLTVTYAVDEEKHVVYLRSFTLLSE
jgi:hypothetical protein